ncbi:MAG: hypothetical protein K2Q06_07880 [Parvularculaceae bacterium]|nr:hypothetical protein [Parvularculaceae bacterium]
MRFGVVASVLLHCLALAAGFLFIPRTLPAIETPFIPVALIDKAELAEEVSVPEAAPKTKPEPPKEEPKPAPPEETKAAEATPPPQVAPPPPTPQETRPDPKAEKTPEPPKKEPPKPKSDPLDLDALAAVVDKEKKKAPSSSTAPREADQPQARQGAGARLTTTEEAQMQAAIRRCWNLNAIAGAPDAKSLVVVAAFELNRDGTLAGPPRSTNGAQIALSGNRFWKAAEQSALRAIIQCQPYSFLSPARYDVWREMELKFDPSVAAGY